MLSSWSSCCAEISQRWIFTVMAFIALWLGNGLRVALSITITEMTVPTDHTTNHRVDQTCAAYFVEQKSSIVKNVTHVVTGKLFEWDEYTQGIILSSYFWGYVLIHFPAGFLSERYGGKHFLGLSILIPSVLTFITPLCVDYGGSTALIILRALMGLASGAMYPAASAMLPRWSSPAERPKFGSIVYAGGMLGTVCGNIFAALLIRYSGFGWSAVFYVFGAAGIIWYPFWSIFCYNSPKKHPFISGAELKYLEERSERKQKPPPAPYGYIFTSKQMWAFIIAMFGVDWAYLTMASDLPKYMSSVVGLSIEDNGYLSSLPSLGAWTFSIFGFWVVDFVVERKWMRHKNIRKLLAVTAIMGPPVFILGASYAKCNRALVVAMFVIGMTMMGASYSSIYVNALDLSPNYSATLMSIGNGIGSAGGIFTPYVVGVLTPNQTIYEYRLVFWIIFVVGLLSCVFYLIYGSSEVQPWDSPDFLRKDKKIEKQSENDKIDRCKAIYVESTHF